MVSNKTSKGSGPFTVAWNIILQLNMITLHSEWGLKSALKHMSAI